MAAARIAGDAFASGGVSRAIDNVPEGAPDASLSAADDIDLYLRHLFLPWQRDGDELIVAHAGDGEGMRRAIADVCGGPVRMAPMPKRVLVDALQQRFRARLAHDAALALDEAHPALSARRVVTPAQRWAAVAIAATAGLGALAAPETTEFAAFVALALLYGANIVFRLVLYAVGWSGKNVHRVDAQALAKAADADLPVYTILVPLYREAHMMARIVRALRRLDYPPDKIDAKIILEENDADTLAAARGLDLDDRFEILVVPEGDLHTKPRACNYALRFARGEFAVIFDAEDRPESDQLKKAALAFRAAPEIACFQARLAFHDFDTGWLSSGIMAQTPQAA